MLVLASVPAVGQERESEQPVTPNTELFAKLEKAVIRIHSIFDPALHPVIGGIAPNSGLGAGLGYSSHGRGLWNASAKTLYTWNSYWLAEGIVGYRNRRAQIEAFGRVREMTQLDFFGSGPNSHLFNRTSYSYRDPVVGAHGKFRVAPWLALAGRVEEIWPSARSGKRSPTIEQRFLPAETPGLFFHPVFGRYQGAVDIRVPAPPGNAFYQGTRSRVAYAIYDQQDADLFNFTRLDVEAQQIFTGFGPHHRLTLSGWTAMLTPDGGQDIPFAMLPTLGGRSSIRSVHDDRIGSDGTEATLRGYRDLRFSDRNLLLLQAEYRIPLWGPVDATLFADAGKVAFVRKDLDFTDLRRDAGFSLSIMKGWETWARVDVGFGSGEGTRVFFTLGDLTP